LTDKVKDNVHMAHFFLNCSSQFAEEINATINTYLPPKFLKKDCKKPSPYFFHGALLHRLYGVDAPVFSAGPHTPCIA